MDLTPLFKTLRANVSERIWDAGIRLHRAGVVQGRSHDDDEIFLWVSSAGRSEPLEVYLYPADKEWACDCGFDQGCGHVVACVLAVRDSQGTGSLLPKPAGVPVIEYRITADPAGWLNLQRFRAQGGNRSPINGRLAKHGALRPTPADRIADQVLSLGSTRLPRAGWVRMLEAWASDKSPVFVDDVQVQPRVEPLTPVLMVRDEGRGFKLSLHRDKAVDRGFKDGVVLDKDSALRPYSQGGLAPHERRNLAQGMLFSPDQAAHLVGEILPSFEGRLRIKVLTSRLPTAERSKPRLSLNLTPTKTALKARVDIVYGDPPVARVERGELHILSEGSIPLRDRAAERQLISQVERMQLPLGREVTLNEEDAIRFVRDRLGAFDGQVRGSAKKFQVRREPVRLDFDGERLTSEAELGPMVAAWRAGKSLVPLTGGGFAPLPRALLEAHGELIADLVAAKGKTDKLPAHATFAAAKLAEALNAPPPLGLAKLKPLLEDFDGLPPARLPKGLQATLRPYQELGVRWLGFLAQAELGGILADDMGLGKTLQALTALTTVLQDQGGKALVVAPTSILQNWQREANKFVPGLKTCVFHGSKRKLDPAADLIVTSYALMRLDPKISDARWTLAILDEAQAIKNPESQTAQAAFALNAKHRWSLTGTPIENRLDELWSQLNFSTPGLLGGRKDFQRYTARAVEAGDRRAAERLRAKIAPFVLRRHKSQVATDLPSRTDVILPCPLTPKQREIYQTVAAAGRAEVANMMGSGRALEVLELLLRMRQAACHPRLLPGDRPDESGKLDVLIDRLTDVIDKGSKALVFSQWTGFLDLIQEALVLLEIPFCRLDGSTRDRQAQVDRFQSQDGPPVFLISLKAGGTGLNLTAADYVFHTDPWWNPAVEDQATDRAHRIGQTKPVMSVKLVSEDTVEEGIVALQDAKRALAEAALSGEADWVERISKEDLVGLFG